MNIRPRLKGFPGVLKVIRTPVFDQFAKSCGAFSIISEVFVVSVDKIAKFNVSDLLKYLPLQVLCF